jgi:pseudaminic acid cytidylyltransferase
MIAAIIPARGGSVRIPEKNIKLFAGKPIIAYTIEAAQKSKIFDRIVVSTDSKKIADIAESFGAEIPFVRPSELAGNETSVADVIYHAISWYKDNGNEIKSACCLVACAPFIKADYIIEGYNSLQKYNVDTVMSVTKYPHPIFRAFRKNNDGTLSLIHPEHEFSNSNDLPQAYHDAAQFYWLNAEKFLQTKSILGGKVIPIILPEYIVQDIDIIDDWEAAEIKYEVCKRSQLL